MPYFYDSKYPMFLIPLHSSGAKSFRFLFFSALSVHIFTRRFRTHSNALDSKIVMIILLYSIFFKVFFFKFLTWKTKFDTKKCPSFPSYTRVSSSK